MGFESKQRYFGQKKKKKTMSDNMLSCAVHHILLKTREATF
jgi:hypothetical protein